MKRVLEPLENPLAGVSFGHPLLLLLGLSLSRSSSSFVSFGCPFLMFLLRAPALPLVLALDLVGLGLVLCGGLVPLRTLGRPHLALVFRPGRALVWFFGGGGLPPRALAVGGFLWPPASC